ncbi:MAG: hypothetical protein ACHQ7M_23570, partial [Chloroflexota bacterium]
MGGLPAGVVTRTRVPGGMATTAARERNRGTPTTRMTLEQYQREPAASAVREYIGGMLRCEPY